MRLYARLAAGVTLASIALFAQTPEERVRRLERILLAPCCYTEPAAVHRSETATEMRAEIARFVKDGRTDREIVAHYKRLHGARVLIEPEGLLRFWAYLLPPLAAALGLAFVILAIRRMLSASRPAAQSR
jgi:cytochrome c-type biogenesis protein CcmH/NrfF